MTQASTSPRRGLRGRWSDDHFTLEWMLVAIVTCGMALAAPHLLLQPLWTPIHAVALGVMSNGIFQWSWFFSRGLLHFPIEGAAKYSTFTRLIVLNVGILLLFAAMWTAIVPLALAATVLICAAGIHQGVVFALIARKYRKNRFAPIVRYYAVAFFAFVFTCLIGGVLAWEMMSATAPAWLVTHADGIAVVHSLLGVGGWAGITIFGTVVTLGLSMLHARQDAKALASADNALPLFVAAIVVASSGALAGKVWLVAAGIFVFIIAAIWGILLPLYRSFKKRRRSSHSVWPLLAGLAWTVVLLLVFAAQLLSVSTTAEVRNIIISQLGIFIAAGMGQIFVASLAYLIPVAIGGGPSVQRVGDITVALLWPTRLGLRNGAIVLLFLVGVRHQVLQTILFVVVLITYAIDLILVVCSAAKQLHAKKQKNKSKSLTSEAKKGTSTAEARNE